MPLGFKGISGKISPLILGSFIPEDDDFILRLLNEVAVQVTGIEFTFKPHPLSIKPFLSDKVSIRQSNQELWDLLQGATHVLIGSSTSAVIEVIEAEIPFSIFHPPSTVNLSPLNTMVEVDFLNNSAQLICFLNDPDQKNIDRLKVEDLVTPHGDLELWKLFVK
jgi:hypothetical protein